MTLTARKIAQIEKNFADGLSSKQILEVLAAHGEPLTEATLRKYVQLGLLPRSRRVGQKGKHRGSKGIYPVEVIRRVSEIRRAMMEGATLEDLARTGQAVRAQVSAVRAGMEEAVTAAEADLVRSALDRSTRSILKARLVALQKEGKVWLQTMETFAKDVANATSRVGQRAGSREVMHVSQSKAVR
ncbi:MAG: MerR family transcriptional regulator [Deltaproteobacteria bacterium]|nr:MerR family transcriptional regulator [Deltaproteobacteria bacterium]